MPDFTVRGLDGKRFDISEYKEKKPVYLIFWATWCPICKKELPKFKEMYKKYGRTIEFMAINPGINDSIKKMKIYIKKYKVPYPTAFDITHKITKMFRIFGTPTQVIIDINGTIRYRDSTSPDNLGEHMNILFGK